MPDEDPQDDIEQMLDAMDDEIDQLGLRDDWKTFAEFAAENLGKPGVGNINDAYHRVWVNRPRRRK